MVRATLRRLSGLFRHYGAGEPPLDYRGLVARAQQVQVAQASLSWFDWHGYFNRQETRMLLGGMLGEVTYSGDLGEFLPVLRRAAKVHLGKATTFGLGKIQLSSPSLK